MIFVPHEEKLYLSCESVVILGNLSPSRRIAYSPSNETISLSGEVFDLLGWEFHRALRKDLLSSLSSWMSLTPLNRDPLIFVLPKETPSPSGDSISIMGNQNTSRKIAYIPYDETISIPSDALDPLGWEFHRALM